MLSTNNDQSSSNARKQMGKKFTDHILDCIYGMISGAAGGITVIFGKEYFWPNAKVSDGSQPSVTFDLSLSKSAGSRSLYRLVRACAAAEVLQPS
jgi:hypothetical protein